MRNSYSSSKVKPSDNSSPLADNNEERTIHSVQVVHIVLSVENDCLDSLSKTSTEGLIQTSSLVIPSNGKDAKSMRTILSHIYYTTEKEEQFMWKQRKSQSE